jgi:phospholipase C
MPLIEHVFVLMLENRSFDHMLGFSGLTGADAVTGQPTRINGTSGGASNSWSDVTYPAASPAVDPMNVDPYHEFSDVLEQLCGHGATYPQGGPYPPINNTGFVSNFAVQAKSATPGDVMKCFVPQGLPVLTALAKEFAVCDSWFSSLPGPTWPNRFFALGASSAGLDHSPSKAETAVWQSVGGFKFQNGSIFEGRGGLQSPNQKLKWRIYAGNIIFTLAHALQGIHITDITRYSRFAPDLQDPNYPAQFTWIEPNYGHVTTDYIGGNSQHPLDGVTGGETMIKSTYETIRSSPLWESSLLIITWDEHGGYFDNVAPPSAIPPGDKSQFNGANKYGFAFNQYGPRVPAVIVSPLIPRNTIDHRPYDHASIPATIERLFNLAPLTARNRGARDLVSLASLPSPRPVVSDVIALGPEDAFAHRNITLDALETEVPPASRPDDPIEPEIQRTSREGAPAKFDRNLPGFIYLAARTDAELPPAPGLAREAHEAGVRERVGGIVTRGDARDYFEYVRRRALETEPGLEPAAGAV